MNIKYFCFYDIKENKKYNRKFALSAVAKIDYIKNILKNNKIHVNLISLSESQNKKFTKTQKYTVDELENISFFFSTPYIGKMGKYLSLLFQRILLFFYLLIKVKKKETIIVYHSTRFWRIFSLVKSIKKIEIVLEVEELYSDVNKKINRKKEIKYIEKADKFIFSNDVFEDFLKIGNKKNIILYGTYTDNLRNIDKYNDAIHLVYGGTFSEYKGGLEAIRMMKHLDENYHLNILGFGTNDETQKIQNEIIKIQKETKCKITYHGKKTGEDYIKFLNQCHIGLSPQNPQLEYNNTSFPSKALFYMSCGLNVVSTKIPPLAKSKINQLITYYEYGNSQDFKEKIENIKIKDKNEIIFHINNLSKEFEEKLINLISKSDKQGGKNNV